MTGLANAKTYYFTVKASNLMGSSPASLETFAIPAATVPTAPTHVAATRERRFDTSHVDAPSNPGGSNITGYTVTAFDSTVTSRGGERCEWTAGPLTCTISDVTNGDSYTFSVTATNSLGTSVASTVSNTVVPAVTVPLVPNSVTATPGNTAVVLSWIAPVTGGSVITGYNVYEEPSQAARICPHQ